MISTEINEDKQIREGKSVYKTRKGYIAHLINLCVKMRELAEKNEKIKEIVSSIILFI